MEGVVTWIKGREWLVGLTGTGLVFLVVGGLWWVKTREVVEVQILEDEVVGEGGVEVWVDIQGAVARPGVYELSPGARVKDVLLLAGGLVGGANREWVSKSLNLAAKVSDGQKIYIPLEGEEGVVGEVAGVSSGKVSVNTAGKSELEELWGIGPARAEAILANRPYARVEEIVSKANVPQNVFERIKEEIGL